MLTSIPISKIGEVQKRDIENDQDMGIVCYDEYARICTTNTGSRRDIGDRSPYRMARLFGGMWQDYNNQYVIQVAGCPLDCPYCYVDNLEENAHWTVASIVNNFLAFSQMAVDFFHEPLNVLHLMGGAPAIYCSFWPKLRAEMDSRGLGNVVLFTNVILVEWRLRNVQPWDFMNLHNFIVEGCLKGTNRENFVQNTGHDLFDDAIIELRRYAPLTNFYLTLINYDEAGLPAVYERIDFQRVDLLKVIEYEATKAKRRRRRRGSGDARRKSSENRKT